MNHLRPDPLVEQVQQIAQGLSNLADLQLNLARLVSDINQRLQFLEANSEDDNG
jgi:hypothetical protein